MAASQIDLPRSYKGSRRPEMLAAIVTTYCIAFIMIVLRVIARRRSKALLGLDDYLIFMSMFLYTAVVAMFLETVSLGAGRHIQTVDPSVFKTIEQLFFSTEITFPLAVCIAKFSILAFYWRIFRRSHESIRYYILILANIVALLVVGFTIATSCQCLPTKKLWEPRVPGHCVSKYKYFMGTAIPDVVTDFAILVLPIPYVWKLHMDRRQKTLVSGVFALGGFASVSSILRLWAFVTRDYQSKDLTYETADSVIWACVEGSFAIIAACLPSLGPLTPILKNFLVKFWTMVSVFRLPTRRSQSSKQSDDRGLILQKKSNDDVPPKLQFERVVRPLPKHVFSDGTITQDTSHTMSEVLNFYADTSIQSVRPDSTSSFDESQHV